MSSDLGVDPRMKKAKEQEKKYDWLEAARSYEQALHPESKDVFFTAETWERIGLCYSRASAQTEDPEAFRKIRQLAVEAYRNAAKLFEKEDSLRNQGKSAQCCAIAAYIRSWLASDVSEKRQALDECLLLGRKSLEAYENAGDQLGYGKMCSDLLLCLLNRLYVASDWKEMKNTAQEGTDCADRAITVLSKSENKSELCRAYSTASLQSWYAANISEQEEKRKELVQKSLSYSEKALQLSSEVDDVYYAAMSNWAASFCTLLFTDKVEVALKNAQEMLHQGTLVRDNYLKGVASYVLAFVTDWMTAREEDPDKKKEGHEKIIQYAEDALRYLQLVSQDFFIAETCLFYAESYSSQAREFGTSPEEKRAMLEKAVEIGRKGVEHATRSGSPDALGSTLHALSKALHFYSRLETAKDEKVKILEEALVHRREYNNIVERVFPSNDWIRGYGKHYEGLIKAELARTEIDKEKKIALLKSATLDIDDGVLRCREWILSRPVPSLIATVAGFEDAFGGTLNELYLLTEEKETLKKAIAAYEDASKKFKNIDFPSRAAECYWKMAQNHGLLGDNQKAAELFESAFTEYKTAGQKIPHLADFYLDYAFYMKAWSEIEKAKSAHKNEEYSTATKHYEDASNLLKPSKLWSYLSPNFLAWSLLEQAEDLSRKERSLESIDAFKKSEELFREAQEAFEGEAGKVTVPDEKEKAIELGSASMRRRDYCLARMNVEQARVCDWKGDYEKSAENYDRAATTFEKILETSELETERKEIQQTVYMCRAWQKMKMADGRDLPELYREASELFMKARDHSIKYRTSLLASGNNALCKALEFGSRFKETREKEDFNKAKQFLGSAANYYMKAGFDNASKWTSATEILFDAYHYMSVAEIEVDPVKRMKIYLAAENCLGRSANLYETAGYVGKREEVIKALKRVKEKREFALSLGELLATPTDAASTDMISAPGLSVEKPVGLQKFEGAFVQANLIIRQREVVFGESVRLEVHVANLGKDTAFLMRVEDVIPEGFDLVEKPPRGTVEDGFLNLNGRKLAALGTEEMKLVYKPTMKGRFVFKPRIQYMNEAGEYKSCELEEATVNVKEIGIRGWLRGPGGPR